MKIITVAIIFISTLIPLSQIAQTTLRLRDTLNDPLKLVEMNKNSKDSIRSKPRFGFMAGAGINKLTPTLSQRQTTNIVGAKSLNSAILNLGVFFYTAINKNFVFRPSVSISIENIDIRFQRRNSNGTIGGEVISNQFFAANLSTFFLLNITDKKTSTYFLFGPSYRYIFTEGQPGSDVLPVLKSAFFAEAGFGLHIDMRKTGFIISPEIKYSACLNNIRKESTSEYSTALASLKPSRFSLTLYFRKNKMKHD